MTKTKEIFDRAFDVLRDVAGASESQRRDFVEYHVSRHNPHAEACGSTTEWRFMGKLGMGGKFWVSLERFSVSAYSEDRTPTRDKIMEEANEELKKPFHEWQTLCLAPLEETSAGEPAAYKHDCFTCVFLGKYSWAYDEKEPKRTFDLYVCPSTHPFATTVIARYGSEGSNYMSGLEIAEHLERQGRNADPLVEALRRARERRIVK